MDKKLLRLLIVDDSPDDAELTANVLRKAGYMVKSHPVQDSTGLRAALDSGQWDVVVSEYALSKMEAESVLDHLKNTDPPLPFIILTRRIGDSDLIKIMRAGARDVLLKSQRVKLGLVIERELQVFHEQREHKRTSASVRELEDKHQAIIEGSREAICYAHEGMHVDANRKYLDLLGYDSVSELEGVPILNLIDQSDHNRFKAYLRKIGKQDDTERASEFLIAKNTGAKFHAEITISPINLNGENCLQVIISDVSMRKSVENKLQYLNQRDPLTGLFNRHYFIQELGKTVEKAKCGGNDSVLIYLDLDQLKKINDTFGHAAGDRLLLRLARLFRENLGDDTILSRFGGDEFAILLDAKNENTGTEAADTLQKAIRSAAFAENGKKYECVCTWSVTNITSRSESVQKILTEAHDECEKAKRLKQPQQAAAKEPAEPATTHLPPQTQIPAPPGDANESSFVADWREKIKKALATDGFRLAYQPIISLHGDTGEFYEALIRMKRNDGTLISAGEFMPAAEQSGQIQLIDRWVIDNTIQSLVELHSQGKMVHVFINLSAKAFSDESLIPDIRQKLINTGLRAEYLIFETDETVVVNNPAEAGTFIRAIRKIGCRFAMDNYGNGLGTYNHLRHQPIEFLKIDGALVHNLANDEINQAVLQAMVGIAKALDKKIIAKYVEDAESLSLLWNFGIDYVQGNYLQQADTQLNYDFSGETTLSSEEVPAPNWISSSGG